MRLVLLATLSLFAVGCGTKPRPDHPQPPLTTTHVHKVFASADSHMIDVTLLEMATHGSHYEPMLIEGLAHADRGVREWSAHALGDLGLRSEAAIDALIEAFDDDDDWVRWKAVRALGLIGPAAKRALPLLEPVANAEQEVVVRAAAKVAVQRIKGE